MMHGSKPGEEGRGGEDAGSLEERLTELERLVEELEDVSESEVVNVLDWAVALLGEVNAHIETRLIEAEGITRELGGLLERVDFGPFDEALENLERPSNLERSS